MGDGAHVRMRQASRAIGPLRWALPIVLLPLGAAWGLHSINSYATDRWHAALLVQTLGNDLNNAAAHTGWAIASHAPAPAVVPTLRADMAQADADISALQAEGLGNAGLSAAIGASKTFLGTLQRAQVLLNGGIDAGSFAQSAQSQIAQLDHNAAVTLINAAAGELKAEADTAELYSEPGIWTLVFGVSGGLVVLLWRKEITSRRARATRERRAAVEQSERTFRTLFDHNPAPMWTYDPVSFAFLTVNQAAVTAYGYSREEFRSMTVLDIRPEEDRAAFRTKLSPKRPATVCVRHLLKDGRIVDVEVTADDIETGGGVATLVLARDVTDQRQLEAELHERAFHDALTGLANRGLMADRFERAQALRTVEGGDLAVLVIDLDDFKTINDTLGHTAGDAVLAGVGHRLRSGVRPQDTVARLGGDEFAILIDGAGAGGASALVHRVFASMTEPMDVDGRAVEVTMSGGLVSVPEHASWDAALQHADIAMYEAKLSGKGTFQLYAPGMQSVALQRLVMAADLRRAIAQGEMVVDYQPVVACDPQQGHIHQVEALVRWQHPARGLVPPMEFIPVAEQTGCIIDLGAWVLRTACAQIVDWARQGRRVTVSVNVSGRQLRDPAFIDMVTAALEETGAPAAQLILELTETSLLEDLPAARQTLGELRAAGIRVALDDFGAGYSSLTYLSELPVDIVKIDRAFVVSLENPDRRAMVMTIARLLDTMDVRTVAEGVETAVQLAYVISLGIDASQGFYFSPAVAACDVLAVLDRCESSIPPAAVAVLPAA
jgi:diguanylate cyclase (GGDEF)-like protein/PAS domain S-box-containing protein